VLDVAVDEDNVRQRWNRWNPLEQRQTKVGISAMVNISWCISRMIKEDRVITSRV
jgi:hypothetical protein